LKRTKFTLENRKQTALFENTNIIICVNSITILPHVPEFELRFLQMVMAELSDAKDQHPHLVQQIQILLVLGSFLQANPLLLLLIYYVKIKGVP
jgi:hypothetical protein